MTAWRELRAEIAARLGEHEALFLVEEVSGCDASEWLDIADTAPTQRQGNRLLQLADRRAAGEPLQYVLGSWSFRRLDLMVDPRVLIPRPETEWVAELAIDEIKRVGLDRGGVAVDLGTGSGAIALALATEVPALDVWATDASDDALTVARANIAGAAVRNVRIATGSWFGALPTELRGNVGAIISNPPYIAEHEFDDLPREVADYEPRAALISGPTGLEALSEIIAGAPEWLTPDGVLVCEIGASQEDAVVALAAEAGFADARVRLDLAARPRVLIARRR